MAVDPGSAALVAGRPRRVGVASRRNAAGLALIAAAVAALAFIYLAKSASVHLLVDEATDAAWLGGTSAARGGGLVADTSARSIALLGGDSGARLTVPLGPKSCAALALHLHGSCAQGFQGTGPVELGWSEVVRVRTIGTGLSALWVRAQPSVREGQFSVCAASEGSNPIDLTVSEQPAQTLTIGDGTTTWSTEEVEGAWPSVTITAPGIHGLGCPMSEGAIPQFFIAGWGAPASLSIAGLRSVDVQGVKSELQVNGTRQALGSKSVLHLEAPADFRASAIFRHEGEPLFSLQPDPLSTSRVVIDGLDATPTIADAYPILAWLLSLVGATGLAILPWAAYFRRSPRS